MYTYEVPCVLRSELEKRKVVLKAQGITGQRALKMVASGEQKIQTNEKNDTRRELTGSVHPKN